MKSILHGTALVLVVTAALTSCGSMKHTTDKWGWTDPQPVPSVAPPVKPQTPAEIAAAAKAAEKAKRDAAPTLAPGVMSSNRGGADAPPPSASLTPEFKLPPEAKTNN